MKNQVIDIRISFNQKDKTEYAGICLVSNIEVFMFLNYNEESEVFDGFTIIRNQDFESYCPWEKYEYKDLKIDNSQEELKNIDIEKFSTLSSSIKTLKDRGELIAVFEYSDVETYYVGKLMGIDSDKIVLHLISKNSEWIGKKSIGLEDICYIGFGTEYEKTLLEKAMI